MAFLSPITSLFAILILAVFSPSFALPPWQQNPNVAERAVFHPRQAKRADIVHRASRPQPKRATISPGPVPSCGGGMANDATFVIQFSGSGNTNFDGNYAILFTQGSSSTPNRVHPTSSIAQATVFELDSNCALVAPSVPGYEVAVGLQNFPLTEGTIIFSATSNGLACTVNSATLELTCVYPPIVGDTQFRVPTSLTDFNLRFGNVAAGGPYVPVTLTVVNAF